MMRLSEALQVLNLQQTVVTREVITKNFRTAFKECNPYTHPERDADLRRAIEAKKFLLDNFDSFFSPLEAKPEPPKPKAKPTQGKRNVGDYVDLGGWNSFMGKHLVTAYYGWKLKHKVKIFYAGQAIDSGSRTLNAHASKFGLQNIEDTFIVEHCSTSEDSRKSFLFLHETPLSVKKAYTFGLFRKVIFQERRDSDFMKANPFCLELCDDIYQEYEAQCHKASSWFYRFLSIPPRYNEGKCLQSYSGESKPWLVTEDEK